jgi:hypothetical protein
MRNAAGFALQKPSSPGKQLPQSKVRHRVFISAVFCDLSITYAMSEAVSLFSAIFWLIQKF